MKNRYSYGQSLINNLADERRYEFTLTGKFEDVIGNSLKIFFFSFACWFVYDQFKFDTTPREFTIAKFSAIRQLGSSSALMMHYYRAIRIEVFVRCFHQNRLFSIRPHKKNSW